ncbi:LysE family translocator [Hydrogenophaga sp.]|uniref:LysE family translocator n=1 Tax=Hydrogenophaga sp. TaxID=1904254 RepID=UPI00261B31F0|nr:LysE family translocator [Hydrogenophaga sp.]MCW5655377.1 LysE family translocator [Hydrogenophaga sp.]
MTDILPPWPLLSAFLLASLALAVTPGPAVFYILARSLSQGRRNGLASVFGVALGNFGNALGAALGLAALFALSSLAFTVVKYTGAAYLVYLGVQAIRAPAASPGDATPVPLPLRRVFRDGFVVALLNPKTTLFFAAFLPQFMTPQASHAAQSVALGAIFVLVAAVSDTAYALTAGWVAPALRRATGLRRAGRYLTGGAFIGLGLLAAFSGPRAPRH